jgi:tetratricopeptide (TPR) repeat protein
MPFTNTPSNQSFADKLRQSAGNQTVSNQPTTSAPNPTPTQPTPQSSFSNIGTWALLAFVALLPVLVVPLTNNFIAHSKLFLILFGAVITGLLFFIDSFKKQAWKFVVSPITLPLVIFGLAVAASTFFTQNYPTENLLGMGGVYLGAVVMALFGSSLINKDKADKVLPVLIASVCVVNLASLLQLFGYGPTHLINAITGFELEHNLVFNLSSSSFIALQVGILALVGSVIKIIKTKKVVTFDVVTLPILVLGLGLHIWSILPGQPAAITLPPVAASWSVALDSLRIPRSALIGQGPEGYANTFARYKPAWMNTDEYWQFNFGSAMGMPLTTIVQLGFLGMIAWLVLALRFFAKLKDYQTVKDSPITWMLVASLVMQFVLPPSYVLIGLQGALFAFWIARFKDQFFVLKLRTLSASLDDNRGALTGKSSEKKGTEKVISLFTNGVVIAGLLFLFFMTSRAYASFNQLYKANLAFTQDDGVAVYENQRQAVILNPFLDSTRRSYALTNLQIAIALSNKADLTEQEQEQISLLIEQAVREAQAATAIDPLDSQNWVVLAQIYQELIGSVEEAEQWAVNAYVEAIQTNPADPLLRVQLGTVLLGQEQVQQAANLFVQAAELKPNLASAYFYLGQAQMLGQNPVEAKRSWQQALALIDENSEDYEALQNMLEEIEPQVQQMLEAQQQQQQQQMEQAQQMEEGDLDAMEAEPGTSPLGRQIPSLTDQNIEDREAAIGQPGTQPLELTPEDEELVRQSQQPVEPEPEAEAETESEMVDEEMVEETEE